MHPAAANRAHTASADVLVALLAAGSGCDESVGALDELDAFDRLGVCRDQVLHEAEARREGAQSSIWSPVMQLRRAGALSLIEDEAQRLLLCRLAAAVVTADGRVQPAERLVYDHLLDSWGLRQADVAAAIRADPAGVASWPPAFRPSATGTPERLS